MRQLAIIAALTALSATLAWAQPREHEGHGEPAEGRQEHGAAGHHGGQPINWFQSCGATTIPVAAMFFNFATLIALVMWRGKKPISAFLQARHVAIREALEEARRVRAEAETRYREYSLRLETLDQEIARLREEMRTAGRAERDRIVAEAEERAGRLRRESDFLLSQELKQIRLDLEREVAVATVAAAEETLRKALQPSDHERLAEEYLSGLRATGKSGAS